jgi:glycine cleavage system H protein
MEVLGCALPEDRLYDFEQSTWSRFDPATGRWRLGLSASLVAFAGKFHAVTYRALDGVQPGGGSVATVESIRYTGPVRLPVQATVEARNERVALRPKLLNDSPYDAGWLVEFRPVLPQAPEGSLESASAIAERLSARIEELHIHCYPAYPDLELVEIGTECSATLARLDEELTKLGDEEVILLVTDDATSPIELTRWADRTGHTVLEHRVEDSLHKFLLRKEAHPVPRRRSMLTGRL